MYHWTKRNLINIVLVALPRKLYYAVVDVVHVFINGITSQN